MLATAYEYKILNLKNDTYEKDEQELNKLGELGWRVIQSSVSHNTGNIIVILERKYTNEQ